LKVACVTDMGKAREINEDSCNHCRLNDNYDLIIVADGMGGHNAGEVASVLAVKSITQYISQGIQNCASKAEVILLMRNAIQNANNEIYEESQKNISYSGMGTTLTMAMISKNVMLVGHVGDSRAYILKESKLLKITNDHSLVAELVKNGTITEEEALHHPQKNIITRALGTDNSVEVDIEDVEIKDGDVIFLCTDGLTNMISDKEIEEILINNPDADTAAAKLVGLANSLGGYDNITAAIGKTACPDREVKQ